MKRPASPALAGKKTGVVKNTACEKPAAPALAGKPVGFMKQCPRCPKQFWGSSMKNVSYSLRRHLSEVHLIGRARIQSKAARLRVQRKYKRSAFRVEPALAGIESAEAFIVCPKVREDNFEFFTDTRKHLIEAGFSKSSVHRLMGVDCNVLKRGWTQGDLKKHRFLGKYFETTFHSAALTAFEKGARTVFWVEDDCRLVNDTSSVDLSKATRAVSPAGCWMGYYGQPPKWGAHMIGFTEASLKAFMPRFVEMHEKHGNMAVDTIFQILARDEPHILKASPTPLAKQITHVLRGRKVSLD